MNEPKIDDDTKRRIGVEQTVFAETVSDSVEPLVQAIKNRPNEEYTKRLLYLGVIPDAMEDGRFTMVGQLLGIFGGAMVMSGLSTSDLSQIVKYACDGKSYFDRYLLFVNAPSISDACRDQWLRLVRLAVDECALIVASPDCVPNVVWFVIEYVYNTVKQVVPSKECPTAS